MIPIFKDVLFWLRIAKKADFSHRSGGDQYGRGENLHFIIENNEDHKKALRITIGYFHNGTKMQFYVPGMFYFNILVSRNPDFYGSGDDILEFSYDGHHHTFYKNEWLRAGDSPFINIHKPDETEEYLMNLVLTQ